MISEPHKTIFVHIPKVAGQSIEHLFLKDLGMAWENRESLLLRKKHSDEQGPDRLAHLTAQQYVTLGYIDQERFDSYFKFSFVRDPYARTLSLYKYLGYSHIISFSAFLNNILPKKIQKGHFFFMSQYDYLYSAGNCLVDFTGKLEQIKRDIQIVMQRAGIEGQELPHVNKSENDLKRGLSALIKNPVIWTDISFRSGSGNLLKSHIRPEDRARIYEIYKKDFQAFGYEK